MGENATTEETDAKTSFPEAWVRLNDRKQLSRLLYTNPVCFLSTQAHSHSPTNDTKRTTRDTSSSEMPPVRRNVMVLSWLTAINNSGKFMFSLNKRRHTSSILRSSDYFVLSVPIKGMEQLVKDVGHASGRWGSKFPEDYDCTTTPDIIKGNSYHQNSSPSVSKRKKKERRFDRGVPGLETVCVGFTHDDTCSLPRAVNGTVAHLQCSSYKILDDSDLIDEDHLLVLAQVQVAFVHPSYWDFEKNIFRPSTNMPPYLTFFGSQTFGYTTA